MEHLSVATGNCVRTRSCVVFLTDTSLRLHVTHTVLTRLRDSSWFKTQSKTCIQLKRRYFRWFLVKSNEGVYKYIEREFGKKRENCDVLAGFNAITCGYPSGIAESRKREPSAKICKQIDKRRQASCRVRPLAVGTITKKDRWKPVFFCYGAAGRGRTDTVSLPRDFEGSQNS